MELKGGDSDDFDRQKRTPARFPVDVGRLWVKVPDLTADGSLLLELRVAVCRLRELTAIGGVSNCVPRP